MLYFPLGAGKGYSGIMDGLEIIGKSGRGLSSLINFKCLTLPPFNMNPVTISSSFWILRLEKNHLSPVY